jgi:hypothetical protein
MTRLSTSRAADLDRRRWWAIFVVTCLVEGTILGFQVMFRGVDADEGFYLMAGRRVLAGHRPYADFFFPQMPYLPFLHAAVFSVSDASLVAGRLVSAVAGAVLAGLLAATATRATGKLHVGIAMAVAYGAHALIISIVPTAKTYGVADLGLIAAFLLLARPQAGAARALAAGVSAGVAAGTRLPASAAVLVLLAWSGRRGIRNAAAFAAGVVLALLPCVWIAAQDPQNFWFCNVGFHMLRREISGLGPILLQKGVVLAKWTLLPQNLIIWVLALVGIYLQPTVAPAIVCALALGMVYLAVTPTYLQYLTQILPFLLLAGIPALAALLQRRKLTVAAASVYVIGLLLALRSPPEGSARGRKAQLWRVGSVQELATYLRKHTEPDDRLLSWWEGYPFLARRPGFVGVGFWESNAAKKLPATARRRYHVLNQEDVRELIANREPRLIVFPEGTWGRLENTVHEHYRQLARFGTTWVFERRDDDTANVGDMGGEQVPGRRAKEGCMSEP